VALQWAQAFSYFGGTSAGDLAVATENVFSRETMFAVNRAAHKIGSESMAIA
jgi:hypothetical protein